MNESLVIWRCSQYCFDDKTKGRRERCHRFSFLRHLKVFTFFRLFLCDADVILNDEINFSRSEISMKNYLYKQRAMMIKKIIIYKD